MGSLAYNKTKGRIGEQGVEACFRAAGFNVERRRLAGSDDLGDLSGIRGLVIEVKNCKQLLLGPWLDEARIEAHNADTAFPEDAPHMGLVVAKRKGYPDRPQEWYAVLKLGDVIALLHQAGYQ